MENHQSEVCNESTQGIDSNKKSVKEFHTLGNTENVAYSFLVPSPCDKDSKNFNEFDIEPMKKVENNSVSENLVCNADLTTNQAVSLNPITNLNPEENCNNPPNSLDEVKTGDQNVDKENKLPIEKECFGLIQDIIINKVNNIIEKVEEREIREGSPEFEIYEHKDDSEDDSRFHESYVTIDECESDYSIASEGDIEVLYKKDYFKKEDKDDSKEFDDEDVLVLDAVEESEYNDTDYEIEDKRKVNVKDSNGLESLNVEISGKRKFGSDSEEENSLKKFKTVENGDDDKLFDEPANIKVTISNDDRGNDSPYSITDAVDDDPTSNYIDFSNDFPKPSSSFPNFEISVKNKKFVPREEVEYVSQDPQENADNYNEEWLKLKQQIGNEAERYRAIRDRWRNLSIPNPNLNLTYRHVNNPGLNSTGVKDENKKVLGFKNHQRSHSCTSFYENIISKLNVKLDAEKQKVLDQHNVDVYRTQMMLNNELNAAVCAAQNPRNIHAQQNLRLTQYRHEQTLQQLQNCCQTSLEQLENEHMEQVELYQQYMEEVRAFNTFYQGLTVHNDNLELTDEQYEHLAETERMYMVFKDFYE